MEEGGVTVAEIEARVAEVRTLTSGLGHDVESAHSSGDQIWADVLEAIAAGAPNAAELARAALTMDDLRGEWWYA